VTYRDYHELLKQEEQKRRDRELNASTMLDNTFENYNGTLKVHFEEVTGLLGSVYWQMRFVHPESEIYTYNDRHIAVILKIPIDKLRLDVRSYNGSIWGMKIDANNNISGQITFDTKNDAEKFQLDYIEPLLVMRELTL
jgi:hypothetical protein